jgi:LacI family transcriptional regulator
MKKKTQVTLYDIAKRLNVSKVTISKALRDHPDISHKTKEKVQQTAKEMGYLPNFLARNLSTKRSGTIGLVVPKIAHHFFSTAVETVYDTALEHNYEVILMVSQESATRELFHIQTLLSMRVDGLLVSVSKETKDKDIFDLVKKLGIPLVFFDRIIDQVICSTVITDDLNGSIKAIEYAISCGYHHIAHLAGYSHTSIGRDRLAGYIKALKRHHIFINDEWIIEGGFSEEDGSVGFQRLMQTNPLPELIFSVTYPVALGVMSASRQRNVQIPEQLGLISFGGSDYNQYIYPSITCVDQPASELAKLATNLLLDEVLHPEAKNQQHIKLPVKMHKGNTCIKKVEMIV